MSLLALHIPDVPAWAAGLTALGAWLAKQPAIVPKALAAIAREAMWLRAALRFLKGARTPMPQLNALQLIPLTIEIGEDALALAQAIEANDKTATIAAVVKAVPLVAQLAGKDPSAIAALVTPERVGAVVDLVVLAEKIIPQVEALIAKLEEKQPAAGDAPDHEDETEEGSPAGQPGAMPEA